MSSTQEKLPQEAEFIDWCCRYGTSLEEIVYSGSALRKGNTVDQFSDDDVEYLREAYDDLYRQVIQPIIDSAKREGAIEELKSTRDMTRQIYASDSPAVSFEYLSKGMLAVTLSQLERRIAQLEQSEESI